VASGGGAQVLLYEPPWLCTHPAAHQLRLDRARSCDAPTGTSADVLACHHCGRDRSGNAVRVAAGEVRPLGHGTERVEETLAERFPPPVERFDRDNLRAQAALKARSAGYTAARTNPCRHADAD
jgi:primosomal protein N' (replication factor Y)